MKTTTWKAWLEWKKECALALCGQTTQEILSAWAAPQVRNIVRSCNSGHELAKPPSDPVPTTDPAWSKMEVHFVAGRKSAGKTYKNALFRCAQHESSAEGKRNALERYFSRVCQNEIPKIVLKEQSEIQKARASGVDMVSLDQPGGLSPDAPSFGEIFTGADHEGLEPDSKTADADLNAIAKQEAEAWLPQMTLREKLAWGCVAAERSRNDPAMHKVAGCAQSEFYNVTKKAEGMQQFRVALFAKYAGSDPQTLRELAIRAGSELARLCISLLPPENPTAEDL
ncbi:MAG: hypothetical protein NT154_30750 [Verrucomicrobia bacterium]|nr:hypothetical protein [Verrucomicrobiota bacterium]